jgi:hypothetical protein
MLRYSKNNHDEGRLVTDHCSSPVEALKAINGVTT